MKSRRMIIGVLLFVAVAVSSATFAYWASEVNGNSDEATGTVEIGEGESVDTTVSVDDVGDDGTLVPEGYEDDDTVSSEDKEFNVKWDADDNGADGIEGTLSVEVKDLTLGEELSKDEIDDMFTIDVSDTPTITEGSEETYTVNVEFTNEPANKDIYDEVADNELEIDLTFTVSTD